MSLVAFFLYFPSSNVDAQTMVCARNARARDTKVIGASGILWIGVTNDLSDAHILASDVLLLRNEGTLLLVFTSGHYCR